MQPQPDDILLVQLQRQRGSSGRTHHLMFLTGDGFGRANYVPLDQVQPFSGETTWAYVRLLTTTPWPLWDVVGAAEPPRHAAQQ